LSLLGYLNNIINAFSADQKIIASNGMNKRNKKTKNYVDERKIIL
jgi:hypothetical protein